MLGPAGRLAPGAGDLPGRLLALLWPALVLGAAALLVLLRRGRAGPGPRRRARGGMQEEEEDGDGDAPAGTGALPAPQREEQRLTAQPKKKRKAQCSDKEVPKDLLSVEKDKLQEEEGVWQTKISSREKRHLRKERLKQKGKKDPSRATLGSSTPEPAFDWDEKGAVWSLREETSGSGKGSLIAKAEYGTALNVLGAIQEESACSQSEEDVFSNIGTWDIAEVKSCPVTFGTLQELSGELGEWSLFGILLCEFCYHFLGCLV
ncbi:uncharacterized protein LOC128851831 isoform X5 [Cuculus canorus]|uniref:uncharacterized protein LOC128851831 isoform X5 n=1 Tax=Cuculus canorus TaxID=55661 RepID=UPI0023AA8D25|nr:uncharacterized protein LOC128851831 isoform X5 [Cuculus canorus]